LYIGSGISRKTLSGKTPLHEKAFCRIITSVGPFPNTGRQRKKLGLLSLPNQQMTKLLITMIAWEYPSDGRLPVPTIWDLVDKNQLMGLYLALANGIILEMKAEGNSQEALDVLIREALEFQFYGICVPPFWVKRASRELGDAPVSLITVAGFPLGYSMTETKLEEIKKAIQDGADEVDMVWNISAFKSNHPWTKVEVAKSAKLVHENQKILKVIIETTYLSDEEIKEACKICADAGADFVKTSTGFAGGGAKTEQIKLMRSVLPNSVGIKASGGIKTFEQAIELIEAGADRIGTSSGVQIIKSQLKLPG